MPELKRATRPMMFMEALHEIDALTGSLEVMKRHVARTYKGADAQFNALVPGGEVDTRLNPSPAPKQGPSTSPSTGILMARYAEFTGYDLLDQKVEGTDAYVFGQNSCWTTEESARDAMRLITRGTPTEHDASASPKYLREEALAYANWIAKNFEYFGWHPEAVHKDDDKPDKDQLGLEIDKIVATGKGIKTMAEISRTATMLFLLGGGTTQAILLKDLSGALWTVTNASAQPIAGAIGNAINPETGRPQTSPFHPSVVAAYVSAANDIENSARFYLSRGGASLDAREQIRHQAAALFSSRAVIGTVAATPQ